MDWFLYDNSLRHKRVNYLIENLGNPFGNGLLDSYFFKMTLGTDCLKLYFWTVAFKPILTHQYYKNTAPSMKLNLPW